MRRGTFTPWARVYCAPCHNALPEERRSRGRPAVVVPDEDTGPEPAAPARCDECDAETDVGRTDVALCQRVARLVEGASLWQTGGMCVAAGQVLKREDGSPVAEFLATEDEETEGAILVGVSPYDAGMTEEDEPRADLWREVYNGSDLEAAAEAWRAEAARLLSGGAA